MIQFTAVIQKYKTMGEKTGWTYIEIPDGIPEQLKPGHKKEFQRLKGLGEMDWEELKSTTMDSMTRTLLQVTVEEAAIADETVSVLMGDDVDSRKQFIITNARDVRNLDF